MISRFVSVWIELAAFAAVPFQHECKTVKSEVLTAVTTKIPPPGMQHHVFLWIVTNVLLCYSSVLKREAAHCSETLVMSTRLHGVMFFPSVAGRFWNSILIRPQLLVSKFV